MNPYKTLSAIAIFGVIFFASCSRNNILQEQSPKAERSAVYGGEGNDAILATIKLTSGGYLAVGASSSLMGDIMDSHGGTDFWVLRLNDTLGKVWSKTFGGPLDDVCFSIVPALDGNFYLIGYSRSSTGDVTGAKGWSDGWIIKMDADGNPLWKKNYGGSQEDFLLSGVLSSEGNLIVAGSSFSADGDLPANHGLADVWLMSIDPAGNVLWSKNYGGSGFDFGQYLSAMPTGGFAITATSNSKSGDVTNNYGGQDFWILRTDASGNLLKQKVIGGSGEELAGGLITDVNGTITFTGTSNSNDSNFRQTKGKSDMILCQLNDSLNVNWLFGYGGSESDTGVDLQRNGNNFMVCGASGSTDGDVAAYEALSHAWIVEVDGNGRLLHDQAFGGKGISAAIGLLHVTDKLWMLYGRSDSFEDPYSSLPNNTSGWIQTFLH